MAIERTQTAQKVISIIADQLSLPRDQVLEDSTFEALGADSLDRVEIVMKLEEEFNVEIRDEDADSITTVGKAIDYLHNLRVQGK